MLYVIPTLVHAHRSVGVLELGNLLSNDGGWVDFFAENKRRGVLAASLGFIHIIFNVIPSQWSNPDSPGIVLVVN